MTRHVGVEAEDLGRLTRRVWPDGPDSPVLVSRSPLPETHVTLESYAVVPSAQRPRYLVPLRSPRSVLAAASRLPHSSLVRRGARLTAAVGTVAWSHVGSDRLYVGIARSVPPERWPEHLLLRRIAAELDLSDPSDLSHPGDPSDIVALLPVRRVMPTTKPILRLFDRRGRSLGFAKVGWSTATRRVVGNEVEVLLGLRGRLQHLQVPSVLGSGELGGNTYLVTTPAPSPMRVWSRPPQACAWLLTDVARSGGLTVETLSASRFRARILAELDAAQAGAPTLVDLLRTWLLSAPGTVDLEFGRWHGDWTRWNVVEADGAALAWDWEFSEPSVPVGFDLMHWHFQQSLAHPQGSLDAAVHSVYAAAPVLAAVGVHPARRRLVASLYLIEILTRACRLNAQGGGWNPRVYPDALEVAAACLREDRDR
ncbi:MAG TPA: hypothetical protein VNP20_18695 [Nocardioidaceae bacterium]|nr:hypothetical protein [Nocardioidaceae bacterium]